MTHIDTISFVFVQCVQQATSFRYTMFLWSNFRLTFLYIHYNITQLSSNFLQQYALTIAYYTDTLLQGKRGRYCLKCQQPNSRGESISSRLPLHCQVTLFLTETNSLFKATASRFSKQTTLETLQKNDIDRSSLTPCFGDNVPWGQTI